MAQAYWEAEHDAEEKRRAKREDGVIKRWTKLIYGLRIRQRLQEQYADSGQRGNSPTGVAEEVSHQVLSQTICCSDRARSCRRFSRKEVS